MAPAAEPGVGTTPHRGHRVAGWPGGRHFRTVTAVIPTGGRPLASTGAASPLRLVLTGPFLSCTWLTTAHASLGLGVTFVIFLAATIMVVLTLSLSFTAVLLPPMLWPYKKVGTPLSRFWASAINVPISTSDWS